MFRLQYVLPVVVVMSMKAVCSKETTTEFDYEVPGYITDFGRELKTLDFKDAYEDKETLLEKMGPRNLSYMRSENYDYAHFLTTLSIEEDIKTEEHERNSGENERDDEYDSGISKSLDPKHTVPVISIWPGWTPFTFHFPTPGALAMRYTDIAEDYKIEQINLDEDPNEPLRWDHLIHTPKMAVVDFDYTLVNFTTDLLYAPLTPYLIDDKFPAAMDEQRFVFVPHDEVRNVLTSLRSKGVKIALIAKERRPELVTDFLHCANMTHLFDFIQLYQIRDPRDTIEYLKELSAHSKVAIRDMIYLDENFQSLRDAFRLGATPQRVYVGLTMKAVNECLNQHNQFNIHGVLPHKLFTATGIPGIERAVFEDPDKNPVFLTTMSPEDYKKEYDKHIAALNKQLRSGHPPFPRWTKWRH